MSEKGTLIVFEGISGSGKSRMIQELDELLTIRGYRVVKFKWNESRLIENVKKRLRSSSIKRPRLYSLIEWIGFCWTYRFQIMPSLKKDRIVICDRYAYTGIIRDLSNDVRTGLGIKILRRVRKPTAIIYISEGSEVCYSRIMERGKSLYYTNRRLDKMQHSCQQDKEYLKLCEDAYKECFVNICKEDALNILEVSSSTNIETLYEKVEINIPCNEGKR